MKMNADLKFDAKTSDNVEKKKETPRIEDLQNLVEDLKDYKATRQLKDFARREKEQQFKTLHLDSSIGNEIEQIEGQEKDFTWPKDMNELDFDRPIGEDSLSIEEIPKDPRGPGFVQPAEPYIDEGENSDTVSIHSDSEKNEPLVSRRIILICIFVFVLAAAASTLVVFLQPKNPEKKSHKREIYPNSSSVKIFSDAYNTILWEDPYKLIPNEIKQKIASSLRLKGKAMSNGLFDCISNWKGPSEARPLLKELMIPMSMNVDVNRRNQRQLTPLMMCTILDSAEAIETLIRRGADTKLTDKFDRTALDYAKWMNCSDIITAHEVKFEDIIFEGGAVKLFRHTITNVISWRDPEKLIPDNIKEIIECFVRDNAVPMDDEVLDTLFCWKADPRANAFIEEVMLAMVEHFGAEQTGGSFKRTFLMVAAEEGSTKLVRKLIEKGAKTEAADVKGHTALHYAARNGNESACKELLENGANVNAQTRRGTTPLIHAAKNAHPEVVKILLDGGADSKIKDKFGETALMRAEFENCREIIKAHEVDFRKN